MLTRAQQILIKRAQAEAGLPDAEYREAVALVSGFEDCRSSTDRRLNNEHFDALLAYIEAIYWEGVNSGALQPACKGDAVFRRRGYWGAKNRRGNTSRDRHTLADWQLRAAALESRLAELGCGLGYVRAIQNRLPRPLNWGHYVAALERTLRAKLKSHLPH